MCAFVCVIYHAKIAIRKVNLHPRCQRTYVHLDVCARAHVCVLVIANTKITIINVNSHQRWHVCLGVSIYYK